MSPEAYDEKYDGFWGYVVRDGALYGGHDDTATAILTFEVAPTRIFGFGREGGFSQSRWQF